MTSLFSLSSNPLATPVGALIDRATDSNSTEENVDLFYEVCEMINAREEKLVFLYFLKNDELFELKTNF